MKLKTIFSFLFITMLFTNCSEYQKDQTFVNNLSVKWTLIENSDSDDFKYKAAFTIQNNSKQTLDKKGWAIYYSQISGGGIDAVLTGGVKIESITGDFVKLSPTEDFLPLAPNQSIEITYNNGGAVIKNTDAPKGMYMVFENDETTYPIQNLTIAPLTTDRQLNRSGNDNFPLASASNIYNNEMQITKLPLDEVSKIIPTPVLFAQKEGSLVIDASTEIHYQNGLEEEAQMLANDLGKIINAKLNITKETATAQNAITLILGGFSVNEASSEAYKLMINPLEGVVIKGTDKAGLFYGIQSLKALISPSAYKGDLSAITINSVEVEDAPRFPYRGMHLDVARNFNTKASILKLLDLMAFYKLNKFHFHLTDDEGWRLEIPGIPELTDVGATRGHTIDEKDRLYPAYGSGGNTKNAYGSGYYTKADFIEILKYAKARHIEVIPEIDLPGHARAAIVAMKARLNNTSDDTYLLHDPNDESKYKSVQNYDDNVICVCQPSVYTFLDKIVNEISEMYKAADLKLKTLHTGGDEVPEGVWEKSPMCADLIKSNPELEALGALKTYFLKEFNAILKKHDITTGGWEEIALSRHTTADGGHEYQVDPGFVNQNFQPYVWNSIIGWGGEDRAYKLANAGYKVVMCNASNLYFDCAYDKDPREAGLYWAGFVSARQPYEFVPFDLLKTGYQGRFGERFNPDELAKGKTKLTETGKQNILGIQGQLWSETIKGNEMLEHYIFPKLLSLAERAWATSPEWATANLEDRKKELNKSWNSFANTIGQREMKRLDHMYGGVLYRIPKPGAILTTDQANNFVLQANIAYPGLTIRYTTDGSEPTMQSEIYTEPITLNSKNIKLRAFNDEGRGSLVTTVNEPLID